MKRPARTPTIWPLLLSFLVYLAPIVHGHGGTLLGIYLWVEFVDGRSSRDALWLAADAGLALGLQAGWYLAFRWILGGPPLRWLLLAGLAPLTGVAVVWAYLLVIPEYFLIEADPRPETGNWPVACTLPDASAAGLPAGVTLALERAGEVWVRTGAAADHGVLSMPGCRLTPRKLFFPGARGGIGFVAPGGAVYYRMDSDGDGVFTHWVSSTANPDPLNIEPPAGVDHWVPVLDAGGGTFAWIETERDASRAVLGHRIATRAVAGGPKIRINLKLGPYANPRLLYFNDSTTTFTVQHNYREVLTIGWDGNQMADPVAPPGFESVGGNIRLLDGGWVVWDNYRENARFRVAWSLPAGSGLYEIPKGRGITTVSVDPGGRYIAVSIAGSYSLGSVRNAVFVLSVSDGAEVWRRYLARHARSQVAFLGSGHLAVTFFEQGAARVDVLEVPPGRAIPD